MENDSANAMDSLSAIRQGHERATMHTRAPWWYYPVLGAGYALLGLASSLSGSIIRTLALIAFLAASKLLQRGFRHATGVWVGGLRSGVATWWSIGFLSVSLGTICAGCLVSDHIGKAWPAWIMAVLVWLETLLYGFLFDHALRRQLRPALS